MMTCNPAATAVDVTSTASARAPLTLEAIVALLTHHGSGLYGGESVTQLEHALQCATLAESAGGTPSLIVAALLHDLGHLAGDGKDEQTPHSDFAADRLSHLFGKAVTEPIRMHVNAKRYLCATDSLYWSQLSEASRASLAWQGGVYTTDQAKRFITRPFADDAVRLRRWDDVAKVPAAATRSLSYFMAIARPLAITARADANAGSPSARHASVTTMAGL